MTFERITCQKLKYTLIPLPYLEILQRRILTTALTKQREKNEVAKPKVYLVTYPFVCLFKNDTVVVSLKVLYNYPLVVV